MEMVMHKRRRLLRPSIRCPISPFALDIFHRGCAKESVGPRNWGLPSQREQRGHLRRGCH